MTDARLPERWLTDRRLLKLSDSAHRTFVTALLWSVGNRTDGRLEVDDLDLMPRARSSDVVELVASGLFTRDGTQLVLSDFAATQTSRDELEVLENARRRDREKKARQRAERGTVPGDSPPGSPPGRVPGTAQDRTGQAGQAGQAGTYEDDPRAAEWWQEPVAAVVDEDRPDDVDGRAAVEPGTCRRCGQPLQPGLVTLGRVEHAPGSCPTVGAQSWR